MSTHAETVKDVLDTLTPGQQMFYAQAIEDASKNPFKALKSLSDDMAGGKLDSAYYKPAALARSAIQGIIDGEKSRPDFADAEAADADILARAAEMEREGRHDDALRLYEAVKRANEKEAEQLESLDAAEAARDAQAAVFKAEKLTAYHTDLERERESLIDHHQLTGRDGRGQRISRQDAEAIYEKDGRSKVEASLQRAHGLTPADVMGAEGVHGNGTG